MSQMQGQLGRWACLAGMVGSMWGALSLPAHAAWGPDGDAPVVLYEHANLGGRSVAIQGTVNDLSSLGFNDKASSAEVRRGQWQLCEHADFKGRCVTLGPGRHALETYFNDVASSIRSLDGTGGAWNSGGWSGGASGSMTLYEHANGGGQSMRLDGAVNDLSSMGFNDKASSIEIHRGNWQLCEHADFRGSCRVLGPGRHNLDDFNDVLSSARPTNERPGGSAWGNSGPSNLNGPLIVYEHGNFDGRSLVVNGPIANLRGQGMNDEISSVEVRQGQWEFCEHADYGGRCMTLGPGRHRLDGWFNDEISSIRPAGSGYGSNPVGSGAVTLYEHIDFRGRSLEVQSALDDLSRQGFNDKASSIEVRSGIWEVCTDAGYSGACMSFGPGRHALGGAFQDSISSIRPKGAVAGGQRRSNSSYDITF